MKFFILTVLLGSQVYAKTLSFNGVDALRMTKMIKGFSNPEMIDMKRVYKASTQQNGLDFNCSADMKAGIESDYNCILNLNDTKFNTDTELKVQSSKKYTNVTVIKIQQGLLQKLLKKNLGFMVYESKVLLPIKSALPVEKSKQHPVIKISCLNSPSECEMIMVNEG